MPRRHRTGGDRVRDLRLPQQRPRQRDDPACLADLQQRVRRQPRRTIAIPGLDRHPANLDLTHHLDTPRLQPRNHPRQLDRLREQVTVAQSPRLTARCVYY
ncbi:hypothetical protein [Rhodococcus sp. HNM0569]|uniref:hypothetical protein n=1 Tax=Rhodococcus sp. HNM0569 TaxID=2716340 RepID=UPI00146B58B0|nr:hypothetical protein [Rhodococcus sp. HNM0569]NLU82485.1 hypothetical protein [Rhodococcus sp. HNM0569]